MSSRVKSLASIPTQVWLPGEMQGAFSERFLEATRGRPAELVALSVFRMCERAYLDGLRVGGASSPHPADRLAENKQAGED